MDIHNFFCDGEEIADNCSKIIANHLLGTGMLSKIRIRYEDLKANFNNVTFDEWTPGGDYGLWKFSSGLTPYMDYDDTSIVPIPIEKELFRIDDAVISLDFPVWFNMNDDRSQRIMFLSQDPIGRDIKWYKDCRDALCTTVFGIHNPIWRNKGNGGRRIYMLASKFVENGYGVYFTDCHKFAIQTSVGETISPDEARLTAYREMLEAEIDMIRPDLIVAFGKVAENLSKSLLHSDTPVLCLPHFSGQAQGKIKEFFNWQDDTPFTIENQVEAYFNIISKDICHD